MLGRCLQLEYRFLNQYICRAKYNIWPTATFCENNSNDRPKPMNSGLYVKLIRACTRWIIIRRRGSLCELWPEFMWHRAQVIAVSVSSLTVSPCSNLVDRAWSAWSERVQLWSDSIQSPVVLGKGNFRQRNEMYPKLRSWNGKLKWTKNVRLCCG